MTKADAEQFSVDTITKEYPHLKVRVTASEAMDSAIYIFRVDEISSEPMLNTRFSVKTLERRSIQFAAFHAGRSLAETRRTGLTGEFVDGAWTERRLFEVPSFNPQAVE